MPQVPREAGTKAERIEQSFAQVPDGDLPRLAGLLLARGEVSGEMRFDLEDELWGLEGPVPIPKRARRELARALDLTDLCRHQDRFLDALARFFAIGPEASVLDLFLPPPPGSTLRDKIVRHVFRNPEDWSAEELFEQLGAFEAADGRFGRFLEALVSADVLLDESLQRHVVQTLNPHLHASGAELREDGSDGGYPSFRIVSLRHTANRRPKNIIFAAPVKPDIRFLSTVDNDIEVLGDPDATLVYDRPVPDHGLRWRDLQDWWQDTRQVDAAEAKTGLYRRLIGSLPANSPGQRNLFVQYHQILATAVYDLPALLPEVWLHWDPRTVRERGREALLNFRMDFLLLLPHGERVVLEVDGSQHYTRERGQRPDTVKYAAMMAGDRDLKLRGYEVFRFGHDELRDEADARRTLEVFIPAVFARFKVPGFIG